MIRRFLLALVLMTCWAASRPASAAPKYVGTFYSGDNVRVLRFDVRNDAGLPWGTAVGTGYFATLEVRRVNSPTVVAVLCGDWENSTCAAVLFAPGAIGILFPTATSPATADLYVDYEATLVLSKGGNLARLGADGTTDPFTFRIKAWP